MLHNILRWEDAHGKAVKLNLCRHRLILVELKSLNLEYPSDGATWWWKKDTVAITQEYWNVMDRSITKTWVENKSPPSLNNPVGHLCKLLKWPVAAL